MASLPVIFDISSDDESVLEEIGGVEDLGWNEPKSNDDDWLLKLLEVADNHPDDSDDVVVVAEFNRRKKIFKSKSCKTTLKDSDDDCVILDGDPDNSVACVNDSAEGSDEILIVAEKGQIACRDYPHPRHLCIRFPFISTPHEKYCDLCHCYVCDKIAPCPFWHHGLSLVKHCHATDKDPMWKERRMSFRKENQASNSIKLPQIKQSFHQDTIQIMKNSSSGSCFSPKNTVSQSTNFQHCSDNNITASTIQLSASSENIFQLRQESHHQLGVDNNSIPQAVRKLTRRDKGNSFSSLPSKFVTSNVMFKKTAAVRGVTQFNRFPAYRNNRTDASQYVINPPSVAPCISTVPAFGDPSAFVGSGYRNAAGSACAAPVKISGQSIALLNGSQIYHQSQNRSGNLLRSSVDPESSTQSASENICQQENPDQISRPEISNQFPNNSSFQHGNQMEDASSYTTPDSGFDQSGNCCLIDPPSISCSSQIIVSESRHGRSDTDLTGNDHVLVNVEERDNCFMGNQSVPPEQDWLSGLNIFSPPPSCDDADTIVFDFETSWND